tara:strand:- start:199 stop:1473 length:1275 start_codon:yes stop_codon:yes gene_type:complete
MKNFLDKIFFRSNNLDYVSKNLKNLTKNTPVLEIFNAINSHSLDSEIRYVGGCVRKIINKEKVDDIDLATNLEPQNVCEALKKKNINFYETGIEHGTITAVIENYKFEITSLREDISTDGRHAKVKFSKDWKKDASRRDFTINSIYSDMNGNLFDPYDGKKDLNDGLIKFIGEANIRLKEDYLRMLRYIRFFLNYSKNTHDPEVIKKLKINIGGVAKLSKDRLLDELRKIFKFNTLEKLSKDKISLELIQMIFPEIKDVKIFSKLNLDDREILKKNDFIFLLSLMIIDDADNADYFIYKFNISKKDEKRIKIIDNFYKEKINMKVYSEGNLNKIFYFDGRQAVLDILNYRIIKSKKMEKSLLDLAKYYEKRTVPKMPLGADLLMKKYKIPEGKQLGVKLKMIETEWVKNNFEISDQSVDNIINN